MIIYAHINIELVNTPKNPGVAVLSVAASLFFVSADKQAEKYFNDDSKVFSSCIKSNNLGDITKEYEEYLSKHGFIPAGSSIHGKGMCYYKTINKPL